MRIEKHTKNAFLFVKLFMLSAAVCIQFYREIYMGIYVCRMVELDGKNLYTFDENGENKCLS